MTVTSEQRKALKDTILNGEFANAKLSTATKNKLNRINGYFDQLTLPLNTTMSDDDAWYVIETFKQCINTLK